MRNLLYILIVITAVACGPKESPEVQAENNKKQELLDRITEVEGRAFATSAKIDTQVGYELMRAYLDYSNQFHGDSISAEFMFKAGDVARNVGRHKQAISIFSNLHDSYPKFNRLPETAFIVAFIYDNDLNDREMAKKSYEKVIELYPEHKLAQDAQARIETLYMTDEELIEMFKARNQEAS
ncbi:MAG: tetratricopeptide repeat protein [Flavobacteriales bacterium]|nr:tetratricopeptide repeat protein [Flavobacteriales bacterium]